MFTLFFYAATAAALGISFMKDRKRTKQALRKAWKAFENILPQFLGVIILIGVVLALLDPPAISRLIGERSGWAGVIVSAVTGAVTLIPGFVAFPTAALLLQNGAGIMQIGAFVSTLMMVGVITIPVEIQYFGKKLTFLRNLLAFCFSFLVAFILGVVAGS